MNVEISEDFKLKFKFLVMSLSVFPFSQILVIVLGHVYSSAVIIVFSLIKGVFFLLKSGKGKLGASLLRKFLFRRLKREDGGGKNEGLRRKNNDAILGILKFVGGGKRKKGKIDQETGLQGEGGLTGGGGEKGEQGREGPGVGGEEQTGGLIGGLMEGLMEGFLGGGEKQGEVGLSCGGEKQREIEGGGSEGKRDGGEAGSGLIIQEREGDRRVGVRDEEEGVEEEESELKIKDWKEEEEEEEECYICLEVFREGEEVVEFRCGRRKKKGKEMMGKGWVLFPKFFVSSTRREPDRFFGV